MFSVAILIVFSYFQLSIIPKIPPMYRFLLKVQFGQVGRSAQPSQFGFKLGSSACVFIRARVLIGFWLVQVRLGLSKLIEFNLITNYFARLFKNLTK